MKLLVALQLKRTLVIPTSYMKFRIIIQMYGVYPENSWKSF